VTNEDTPGRISAQADPAALQSTTDWLDRTRERRTRDVKIDVIAALDEQRGPSLDPAS
jgi:hypothetical protein